MRIVLSVLIAVLIAVAMAPSPGTVAAKTYIQLRPASGPTGSMLQVEGFGFATGDVRIALAPLDEVESGFVDELPEEHLVTLGYMAGGMGADERTAVSLPGASAFTWGKQVDILAIQEDPPTSHLKFFVAKATFDVTRLRELPRAGVGPPGEGSGISVWPIALLAAAGALLALAGLRLQATKG